MDRFQRMIDRDRKRKYKRLRKMRKARDMVTNHTKRKIPLSRIYSYMNISKVDEFLSVSDLAKYILDREPLILIRRPPKPPSQNR